ncbi:MAG TPA: hypothetical protein VLE20_02960, partial [Blastocatellia bacterium]|nr:hypothetical protein [Blastocatellia bacterium]
MRKNSRDDLRVRVELAHHYGNVGECVAVREDKPLDVLGYCANFGLSARALQVRDTRSRLP